MNIDAGVEIYNLRKENDRLRKRVEELENIDGLKEMELYADALAEVDRIRKENEELKAKIKGINRSLSEALNSGDGTYKP